MMQSATVIKIGVFYDGNYFSIVSNYYKFAHPRGERLAISGIHRFLEHEVAKLEKVDVSRCQIADAHYFRGRLTARQAQDRGSLVTDRLFDDVLMREGVVTHYTPMTRSGEKGVDVGLAVEALEMTMLKRYDVVVLITPDGDYVPLVRKLSVHGARTMVLGWDFVWTDDQGKERTTRTSQTLIEEVTYPLMMNAIVDDRARAGDPLIRNLFIAPRPEHVANGERTTPASADDSPRAKSGKRFRGRVQNIIRDRGFGFITRDDGGENLFFYSGHLVGVRFEELDIGMPVEYFIGVNNHGECATQISPVR